MGETDVTKKSKKRKNKKTISFDQETVPKSVAEKLVSEHNSKQVTAQTNESATNKKRRRRNNKGKEGSNAAGNQKCNDVNISSKKLSKPQNADDVNINTDTKNSKKAQNSSDDTKKLKKRKAKNQQKSNSSDDAKKLKKQNSEGSDNSVSNTVKTKRRKRNAEKSDSLQVETQDELDPKRPEIKGEESIRAKKRRKYNELVKQKKLTQELDMQQKCLNYLSLWKHNRDEWKFEKLKQVWLQTHLYDDTRLPNEFWDTAVEYFNGSKGVVRGVILKEALEVVEKEEGSTEVDEKDEEDKEGEEDKDDEEDKEDEEDKDDEDEDVKEDDANVSKVKYSRARSIVQSLQE